MASSSVGAGLRSKRVGGSATWPWPSGELKAEDVADAEPDLIVVAPCGYRLDGAAELASSLRNSGVLPSGVEVWAVDADAMFVRPGPCLVDGVETLASIAHPDVATVSSGAARRVAGG